MNKMYKLLTTTLFWACCILSTQAQSKQITGQIIAEDGVGLTGASIIVKNTALGTITDLDGNYALTVPNDEAVLMISFIGFSTKEIAVGTQSVINITLLEDVESLSEIVVTGYGTQKKSQLTGAISSIKAKDISEVTITNTQQALQGRIAGVDVIQQGSRPGSEPRVVIRGRRSFNASNDPLYVLDGIPLSTGIGDINPNDIQSMEVLKDASSTAIYGARGANGVVLITTKRGKGGKPTVWYNGSYGFSDVLQRIDMMNGEEFAEAKREAYRASGKYTTDEALFEVNELESVKLGRSTDYVSGLLRKGAIVNQQLGFAGGTDKTNVYISFNYFKDNGVVYNTDYNRNVVRFNLDHEVFKGLKIGMSSFINFSIRNGESFNPLDGALRENPLGKPYNDDGTLNFLPTQDGLRSNPFAEIVDGAILNRNKTTRAFAGIFAELNVTKNLKYRFNFGPDIRSFRVDNFRGTLTNERRLAPPTAWVDNASVYDYTVENILTYDKALGRHNFNLTAVQSIQKDRFESSGVTVEGVPAETQQNNNLGNAATISGVRSNLVEWAIASFMGRLNYSLDEKYLLTATIRADGSSRFGANTKWGYFPGVAIAWNVSQEPFLRDVKAIENMKIRLSYGSIGNQAITPYQTQGLLGRTFYNWGTSAAFGYQPNTIGNPDLKWETSTTANIGIDASLFKGRISATLEYYRVNTKDLLLSRQLPTSTGFSAVTTNVGRTRNQGFEGTISTINIDNKRNFKWSTDFTFFTNKEEIVELYNGKVDDVGNSWFIGQPLSVFYELKKAGIWQTAESDLAKSYGYVPGEIKIQDTNNDGKINSSDRVIHGSGVPDFSGGITNRIQLGNFDLSAFVYARIGQTIRSNFHLSNNTLFGRYNNIDIDYWTPANPTNEFPRPNQNQEFPKNNGSIALFDGSFVKVRNINLGYNFDDNTASKLKMSSLRIYTSIQQPFLFSSFVSKYKGVDPETDISQTLDGSGNPSAYTVSFGVSARF